MDLGALYRKLFLGDQSADVIPGVNVKQLNDAARPNANVDAKQINNPYVDSLIKPIAPIAGGDTTPTGGGGGGLSAAQIAEAQSAAKVNKLRGDIHGKGNSLLSIYDQMFGNLDNLLKERADQTEGDYGKQFKQAADQYAQSIPEIQNSYASVGASNSTDTADAKDKAKVGFDNTNATIGKNKQDDLTKVAQYGTQQKAKIQSSKDAAARNIGKADQVTDEQALTDLGNTLDTSTDTAKADLATLGTDSGARGQLASLTGDNGRFQQATNALDSIIKSSMGGAVKQAAVQSIVDNAGLTDDQKKQVQLQYGNVYNEQNAQ